MVLPASVGDTVRPPPATPAKRVRRARILVVDDEPMVARAISRMLGRDHEVTATTHAREALERMRAGERFDIIFSDLMMPEMSGMELFAAIGAVAPEQAQRVVFLTGGAFTPAAHSFLEECPTSTSTSRSTGR
ncbi:MAG: response regulator [Polyangiaceae bacterium]